MSPKSAFGVLITLLLPWAVLATHASTPPPKGWSLDHYQHSAFTVADGAPEGVNALAQTSDGYLWIAGERGLTRFDGVHFQPFIPASGERLVTTQILALAADAHGGLWIGYESRDGSSYLKDGHLTQFGVERGYTIGITAHFFFDPQGRPYAYGTGGGGLIRYDQGSWHPFPSKNVSAAIETAIFDRNGRLWVTAGETLGYVEADHLVAVVTVTTSHFSPVNLTVSPENVLFVSILDKPTRRFQISGTQLSELPVLDVRTDSVTFDHHGGTWLPALGRGVVRLSSRLDAAATKSDQEISETFRRLDGLSGDYAWPSLLDAEGDVWIGTQYGIDRFRESSVVNVRTPDDLQSVIVGRGSGGAVWVGSSGASLLHVGGTSIRRTPLGPYTFAMCYDAATGAEWAANYQGLWRLDGREPHQVAPSPPSVAGTALTMTCGRKVPLLVSYRGGFGTLEWLHGAWKPRPGIGRRRMSYVTSSGDVYFGAANSAPGRLTRVRGDDTEDFGSKDGLDVGDVNAIAERHGMVFVGGAKGLDLLRDKRLSTVQTKGAPLADVTGLAFDRQGNLWIHSMTTLGRISADDIDRLSKDVKHPVEPRWLTAADGVEGVPSQSVPTPSLTSGTDGRLWLGTQNGFAWLDPADLFRNTIAPRVSVTSMVVNGAVFALHAGRANLPAGSRNIEINFNAPMLRSGPDVHFFYRLQGIDSGWLDAGQRRSANYSNLGPGHYAFHVQATNEHGVSSGAPVAVTFTIEPTFAQTWWFRLVCFAAAIGVLWLAYAYRLARVTQLLRVREDERTCIARDLHDTLLQSVQGMVMMAGLIRNDAKDDTTRAQAEQIVYWGRQAAIDARTRIAKMRATEHQPESPLMSVLALADSLSRETGVVFTAHLEGLERPFRPDAGKEIRSVLRELLTNAFRHAHASQIHLSVTNTRTRLMAQVTDDGIGFDASTAHLQPGHWGLTGVRERMHALGGTFRLAPMQPKGTRVAIEAPASRLFKRHSCRLLHA